MLNKIFALKWCAFVDRWTTLSAACLLFFVSVIPVAQAQQLQVTVLDRDGVGVPNVVVYVAGLNTTVKPLETALVVDQVELDFQPHLSIVPVGSGVVFPNSDPIAHHVYSFSRPNDFVLPLYKGETHAPVVFDEPGVVTLGCNIHDGMVGYVAVVDSNSYGLTNADGMINLNVPSGAGSDTQIRIWSPRIREKADQLTAPMSDSGVVFQMTRKLRPAHKSAAGKALWENY